MYDDSLHPKYIIKFLFDLSTTSFGDETLTTKKKYWVPPPETDPVSFRWWGGSESDERPGRQIFFTKLWTFQENSERKSLKIVGTQKKNIFKKGFVGKQIKLAAFF